MRWLVGADPAAPLAALRCDFWGFNSIGFADRGEACVVDPGIRPEEIEALRARLAAAGARVTTVALTHSHHDHIRGWRRFPGAEVRFPAVAAAKGPDARARILAAKRRIDEQLGVDDPGFDYPAGTTTFDEGVAFRVGTLEVELRFLPGHSDCTSVVWIPALRTLCTADYLVSPSLPYCRWRVREYEAAIATMTRWVEEEGVERVVPAHGRVIDGRAAILAALAAERDYFALARAAVRAALDAGETGETIARDVAAGFGRRARQDLDNVQRVLAEERG